jgi:hypothetical protein
MRLASSSVRLIDHLREWKHLLEDCHRERGEAIAIGRGWRAETALSPRFS